MTVVYSSFSACLISASLGGVKESFDGFATTRTKSRFGLANDPVFLKQKGGASGSQGYDIGGEYPLRNENR